MKTRELTNRKNSTSRRSIKNIITGAFLLIFMIIGTIPASAHCDSYDGPTVKDALTALETNNVSLVLKWIDKEQESVIIPLFKKTYSLKNGDKETYKIVETHFLETLVRLHRETEGAPYTGLKPAGTTEPIVLMSDKALNDKDINSLLNPLGNHIDKVLKEKYEKVAALELVKNSSAEKGREYVAAYVDYTHTIEALHKIIEGGASHQH